jgi:xanthomonalisin
VSAEGDYDNPTVDNGYFQTGYAGTSFAAPRWAGLVALANQQADANCEAPVGFIPPTLYSALNTANYTNDFHDVTSGNNNSGSVSYNAVSDYDLVTGLGSPNGQNLINLLAPQHSSPTATSITYSYTTERPTTFSAHVSSNNRGTTINNGYVSFSYSNYSGSTQACSASVINGNASCTVNVNTQTNQYTITASYSGNGSPNGCAASSTSGTAIGSGYGFN